MVLSMGYRRLLKDYIRHVETLTGTHLIDLAHLTRLFNNRDVGELRTLAAELRRERYGEAPEVDYDVLVVHVLAHFGLTLHFLETVGVDPSKPMTSAAFNRVFGAILVRINEHLDRSSRH